MWKLAMSVLQSCYKLTLTAFCTTERRGDNHFRFNELTRSDASGNCLRVREKRGN